MSRKSLHRKSLVLGYYPLFPEMFWSSDFLIFRRKNRWKIIFDGSYGKLFSRSFSFYFSADFSIHSFLNNSWGNFVYKRNQGVECHGNHRTQLHQMSFFQQTFLCIVFLITHGRALFTKQGRIHGNPVADGWAGAVMQKPIAIQKCDGWTNGQTDRRTDPPTQQGVESRVRD